MNMFTFWNENDTKQHVTLAFATGRIWHLSRGGTHATADQWNEIGTYEDNRFTFVSKVPHLWIAATQLTRNGGTVYGAPIHFDSDMTHIRSKKVGTFGTWSRVITDPDTLMGRKKRKSLSLGAVATSEHGASKFGKRFTVDVEAMRAAIKARK